MLCSSLVPKHRPQKERGPHVAGPKGDLSSRDSISWAECQLECELHLHLRHWPELSLAMPCSFNYGIFYFFGAWVPVVTMFVSLFLPETAHWPITNGSDLESALALEEVKVDVPDTADSSWQRIH